MKIYNSLYQKENAFKYLTGFQSCCDTSYSMDGANQKWILQNLSRVYRIKVLSLCNSIKTFDFSTRYTAIPHSK